MKYITLALRISPDREHVEIDATDAESEKLESIRAQLIRIREEPECHGK